jgi:hypothetical protein
MRRRVLGFAVFCASAGVFAQGMQPGMWEMTSEMKMPGMPMPVQKWSHCLSAQDMAAGKQHSMDDGRSKCQMSDMKVSGNNYSYGFTCASPDGKMTGKASGNSTNTSYKTNITLKMVPDLGMGEINQLVTGRRTGDCK